MIRIKRRTPPPIYIDNSFTNQYRCISHLRISYGAVPEPTIGYDLPAGHRWGYIQISADICRNLVRMAR